MKSIERAWMPLSDILRAPRSAEEYESLVAWADDILDCIGEDEAHPLASLLDVVGDLIRVYGDAHFAAPA